MLFSYVVLLPKANSLSVSRRAAYRKASHGDVELDSEPKPGGYVDVPVCGSLRISRIRLKPGSTPTLYLDGKSLS